MAGVGTLRGLLRWLLRPTALPRHNNFAGWKAASDAALHTHLSSMPTSPGPRQLTVSIVGGALGDRLAYAFVAGYQSAIRHLVPHVSSLDRWGHGGSVVACVAITEAQGTHPRAIQSTITDRDGTPYLSGIKTFVTCADACELLLVAAQQPAVNQNRPVIKMALVHKDSPGVQITLHPVMSFVPEVRHGSVALTDVPLTGSNYILKGDGYDGYVKPFRTLEDMHVNAAILAYALRLGVAAGWPNELLGECTSLLSSLYQLASMGDDVNTLESHILLAPLLARTKALANQVAGFPGPWPHDTRDMWLRDLRVLNVAEKARQARLQRAWDTLLPATSRAQP